MNSPFIDRYIDPQYQHEWLVQGLIFVASYVVIYGAVWSFTRLKLSPPWFKWSVSIVNAFFLTLFTVNCSGEFPLLMNAQTAFFSDLYRFQSLLHQNQSINKFLGDNRLLLVDASHDLALVADPSLNTVWGTNQLITDRQKLTRLLDLVAADSVDSLVDMVVCDLTFGEPFDTDVDRALQNALNRIDGDNSPKTNSKLLIAKSQLGQSKSIYGQSAIVTDSLAGGSVDVTKYYEGTFFTHQLFDTVAGGYRFSLPYELYSRLEQVTVDAPRLKSSFSQKIREKRAGGAWVRVPDKFVPEFWITNADVSREAEPIETNWWDAFLRVSTADSNDTLQAATGRLRPDFYYLGQLAEKTDTTEQEGFLNQLRMNHRQGKRSIIFIGLFEDAERDTHQTLVGPMHGSVLLLNVFINLLAGSHRISCYYLLYLLVGFLIVSFVLITPDAHRPPREDDENRKELPSLAKMMIEEYTNFIQGIVNNRAYFLALILLLGAIAFFNHLINIVVIGIYLALLKRMIKRLYYNETE
ncbi:hypothetical protein [Spirosoma arcticum]